VTVDERLVLEAARAAPRKSTPIQRWSGWGNKLSSAHAGSRPSCRAPREPIALLATEFEVDAGLITRAPRKAHPRSRASFRWHVAMDAPNAQLNPTGIPRQLVGDRSVDKHAGSGLWPLPGEMNTFERSRKLGTREQPTTALPGSAGPDRVTTKYLFLPVSNPLTYPSGNLRSPLTFPLYFNSLLMDAIIMTKTGLLPCSHYSSMVRHCSFTPKPLQLFSCFLHAPGRPVNPISRQPARPAL